MQSTGTKNQAMRRFYLVQRIKRSRFADMPEQVKTGRLAALGSNPFGYGRLGDYDLDYMGSAEFEWGALPEAFERIAKAGKKGLATETKTYGEHQIDFLWIKKEGDPFEDWCAWVDGEPRVDDYGYTIERRPCEGKESAYELRDRLDGKPAPEWGWRADVWWALSENVIWAFADEHRHLQRMLDSMATGPNSLRGA